MQDISFPDVIAYAVPAFVLLIILEMFVVRRTGHGRYETKDTFSSLAMGFGNNLIAVIGAGALVYMMYSWVPADRGDADCLVDDIVMCCR